MIERPNPDEPVIEILDIDRVPIELTVGTKYHCTWGELKKEIKI